MVSAVSRSARALASGSHSGASEAHELHVVFVSLTRPRSLLEKIEQETWRETGISFVTSVTRLMERLLDYRYLLRPSGRRIL